MAPRWSISRCKGSPPTSANPRSTVLLLLFFISALCSHTASGFMTPGMVRKMIDANRPPLRPHPAIGDVSVDCEVAFTKGLGNLYVLDAIGKPQAGLLSGNLFWMGHFDECTNITDFNYCLSYLSLTSSASYPYAGAKIQWGLCMPEVCSEMDILLLLNDILHLIEEPFSINAVNASSVVCAQMPPAPYNTGFIVTVAIIGILGVLLLLGAFLDKTLRSIDYQPPRRATPLIVGSTREPERYPYDRVASDRQADQGGITHETGGIDMEEQKPTACTRAWQEFLLCFAVNRNVSKLMSTRTSADSVDCLNGIRVISMSWVMLGHVISFSVGIAGNPLFGYAKMSNFGFQAVANAFFSVDSFFYLSGLLVAYMALGRMAKSGGSVPWHWFYFHRYWRLTPALGVTMLLYMYVVPHMGNGPLWQLLLNDHTCEKDWWTNILYINNFYKGDCIGWVWYLANDMQFFIISPVILILLFKVPVFGLLSLVLLSLVSIIATSILMVMYNYSSVVMDGFNPHPDPDHLFFNVIYIKPYCRITPYLVGMATGYFLHRYQNQTIRIHPTIAAAGWAIATAVGMAVVYGLYGSYHGNPLTTAGNAAYMSLSRIAWAMSLSWVVFACRYGYGGWINDFLSWDVWIPLSRLTYSAYLLHPLIIYSYLFNHKSTYYSSLYTLSFEFAGLFVISYASAVVLALFIEFPLANLAKFITPSDYKKKD